MSHLKSEVLAAALAQTNGWIAAELKRPDIWLELVLQHTARQTAEAFATIAADRRRVHWDWESLYFKKARKPDGWMFSIIVKSQGPSAMCYGRLDVKKDYVSINYLESAQVEELKGLVALISFQFALTVAIVLDIDELRLCDPFEELVPFYERVLQALGMPAVRHPAEGSVQFLSAKVSS